MAAPGNQVIAATDPPLRLDLIWVQTAYISKAAFEPDLCAFSSMVIPTAGAILMMAVDSGLVAVGHSRWPARLMPRLSRNVCRAG